MKSIEERKMSRDNFPRRTLVWKQLSQVLFVVGFILAGFWFYGSRGSANGHFTGLSSEEPAADDPVGIILKTLEKNFAGNWSEKYTAEAHLTGTNFGLADWTRSKFEEYGFETSIDTYEVLASYFKDHNLNLLNATTGKTLYQAPLKEDELEEDKGSQGPGLVPTYLAYAANGDVTAQYVYVNYGRSEDFEKLRKLGVDVSGKIVVARYGEIFRGLKVKFAQENGAVGVLLYSDPGDDMGITPANGYKQYPHGPARQESSVQRGSVHFLGATGSAPGDPTTPGYASTPGVERKDPHDSIGKIPALPISYREVKPILAKLNKHGPKVDDKSWVGELEGYDYSVGPNKHVTLNLYNDQTFNITPIWNVIGEIKGENPHEAIVIGNHRDAWVKGGAGDPNSGSAVLLEVARALGALKESGYKFKRSVILQSYDGEEYGLLGSTERGERLAEEIKKDVVAYLNLDVAVAGKSFHMASSPVLFEVLKEAAKGVEFPDKDVGSLYDHFIDVRKGQFGVLGSDSDYTVYLEHLGVPSVDFGFTPGKGDPTYHYHSNYDSFDWMATFGDKGFTYHNLAAKFASLLILKLESNKIIPLQLSSYSDKLLNYYEDAVEGVSKRWLSKKVNSQLVCDYSRFDSADEYQVSKISSGLYVQHEPIFNIRPEKSVGCVHNKALSSLTASSHKNLTLSELLERAKEDILALRTNSKAFDLQSEELKYKYDNRDKLRWWSRLKLEFQIRKHNNLIQYFERNFLHSKGLHHREWFKHIVYASDRNSGSFGQTLPGLREALEDDDFDRFIQWLGIIARAVRRAAHTIEMS